MFEHIALARRNSGVGWVIMATDSRPWEADRVGASPPLDVMLGRRWRLAPLAGPSGGGLLQVDTAQRRGRACLLREAEIAETIELRLGGPREVWMRRRWDARAVLEPN